MHLDYFIKITKKKASQINLCVLIGFILSAGCIIRYTGLPFVSRDMEVFLLNWFDEIRNMSLKEALSTQVGNYSTTYQFIIFLLTRVPGSPVVLYKTVSILFDVIMCAGIFFLVAEIKDKKTALCAMAFSFLLPTVWLNSAFWGQCDSIYSGLIIWALYMLYKKRPGLSFIFLGFALSFKLQTVFIFPFIAYYMLRDLMDESSGFFRSLLRILLIPLVWITLALPNFIAGKSLSEFFSIYLSQTDTYHKMTLNYPGFWGLFDLKYSQWRTSAIMLTAIILLVFIACFYINNIEINSRHFLWLAFILTYTCVLFLPAMHERYGFLYEILAVALVFCTGRGYLQLFFLQAVTCKTYIYCLTGSSYSMRLLAVINLAVYISFIFAFIKEMNDEYKPLKLFARNKQKPVYTTQTEKKPLREIFLITLVFFCVGIYRIGSTKAPETGMSFMDTEAETQELCLRFDTACRFSKIAVFIGEQHTGTVSAFVFSDGMWEQSGDTADLKSVFNWNEISFSEEAGTVKLIFNNTCIREIVFVDQYGDSVLPENYQDYPELFDEQSYYSDPPTYFYGTMFDEVYHGRTAYEFLHGLPVYENTHPPFGKILIAAGIKIWGMNPFGWRFTSLVFGTWMIPVICLMAYRLTKKRNLTLLAGILLATEFMHFTLSRIATIDIIVAFFVLCMFYGMTAFIQEGRISYLLFSGIASAFGAATKWTACYAMAGIAVILLIWFIKKMKSRNTFTKLQNLRYAACFIVLCTGFFIIIPAVVYVFSYVPFVNAYPEQGLVGHAISNSKSMFAYHSNVFDEHPYASPWYTWIVNWVPLLDSYTVMESSVSTVATFMNPLVCVMGSLCLIHQVSRMIRKRDRMSGMLVVMYAAMLIPWIFITRTVFIYQYFICTQILILMICYSIYTLHFKNEQILIRLTAALSGILFVMYYPVISGFPVSIDYVTKVLSYLPKWVL